MVAWDIFHWFSFLNIYYYSQSIFLRTIKTHQGHMHTHACMLTHIPIYTRTYTHIQAHTHTYVQTHAHTQRHAYTYSYTHMCTCTHMCAHGHVQTHTCTHTHKNSCHFSVAFLLEAPSCWLTLQQPLLLRPDLLFPSLRHCNKPRILSSLKLLPFILNK